MRMKQVKDVTDMIADIYRVGPLTYPKVFQCDNGSNFKAEVTKMLQKHELKYDDEVQAHTHGIHRDFEQASCRKSVQGSRHARVE